MIIRNNADNQRLTKKIGKVIEDELGFRALIDKTWNCRKDIRIEIALTGMDAPFIVSSDIHEGGRFEIKVIMCVREMTREEAQWMHCLLEGLERITAHIQELTTDAKPELSYYANKSTGVQH